MVIVRSTLDQVIRVRIMAGDTALDETVILTVSLSTQEWSEQISERNAVGSPAMNWHPIQGRVEIFLDASFYRSLGQLACMQTLPILWMLSPINFRWFRSRSFGILRK